MRNVGWIGVVAVCVATGLVLTSIHLQRVRRAELEVQSERTSLRVAAAHKEAARIAGLQADYERQVARYGRAIDPKLLVTVEGVEAARKAVADYRAACVTFEDGVASSDSEVVANFLPPLQVNHEAQGKALDRLLDFLTDIFGRYKNDARGFVFDDDADLEAFNVIARDLRSLSNEETSLQAALEEASRIP